MNAKYMDKRLYVKINLLNICVMQIVIKLKAFSFAKCEPSSDMNSVRIESSRDDDDMQTVLFVKIECYANKKKEKEKNEKIR